MEQLLRNLHRRVARIEEILPTLATKADLEPLATKADLEPLATKADLEPLATKADLEPLATKVELAMLGKDLRSEIREEGERTRRYFDVVAESLRDDIRLLADGFAHLTSRLDRI